MRTLNLALRKNDPVDVFSTLRCESLTVGEMNFIRGGGDPGEEVPTYPTGVVYPKP